MIWLVLSVWVAWENASAPSSLWSQSVCFVLLVSFGFVFQKKKEFSTTNFVNLNRAQVSSRILLPDEPIFHLCKLGKQMWLNCSHCFSHSLTLFFFLLLCILMLLLLQSISAHMWFQVPVKYDWQKCSTPSWVFQSVCSLVVAVTCHPDFMAGRNKKKKSAYFKCSCGIIWVWEMSAVRIGNYTPFTHTEKVTFRSSLSHSSRESNNISMNFSLFTTNAKVYSQYYGEAMHMNWQFM